MQSQNLGRTLIQTTQGQMILDPAIQEHHEIGPQEDQYGATQEDSADSEVETQHRMRDLMIPDQTTQDRTDQEH